MGNGLSFGVETFDFCRAGQQTRLNHLQRHRPVQADLTGLVHHSHATAGEYLEQFVITEASGQLGVEGCRWKGPGGLGFYFGIGGYELEQALERARRADLLGGVRRERSPALGAWQVVLHTGLVSRSEITEANREKGYAFGFIGLSP